MPLRSANGVRNNSCVVSRKSSLGEAFAGLALIVIALLVLSTYRGCSSKAVGVEQVSRMPSETLRMASGEPPEGVGIGNGLLDGRGHAGWFFGHFMDPSSISHSSDLEVKFTFNPTGKRKSHFAVNRVSKTMTVLVSGSHRLEFSNSSIVLDRPGDYVVFREGVGHAWEALRDSTILTIRWPSKPGDQVMAEKERDT